MKIISDGNIIELKCFLLFIEILPEYITTAQINAAITRGFFAFLKITI